MKTFFKTFFITLLLLIVVSVGVGAYFIISNPDLNITEIIEKVQNPGDELNFLMLGTDAMDSASDKSKRSDVMMIVNVDIKNKKVNMMSIPRDSRVHVDGYDGYRKINSAYAHGGAELALKTVNDTFGINLDKYVVVDYKFVMDVVDKLGGIDVDIPIDMDYEDPWDDPPLIIHLKAGPQTLNGEDTIRFLRFRKNSDGSGYTNQDLQRVEAHQQVMSALIDSVKSPRTILAAPGIIRSYNKNTENNIPISELASCLPMLKGFSRENINTTTMVGTPKYINKISYVIIDEEETSKILESFNLK